MNVSYNIRSVGAKNRGEVYVRGKEVPKHENWIVAEKREEER